MHYADKHSLGEIELFKAKVTRIDDLGENAFVYYFKRFFDFKPGQVVAISLQKDEPPRLYSIASEPKNEEVAILFKVKPDGFLTPRLAEVKIGGTILVSQPFGAFYGSKGADYWIAVGTGIAPFVSMQKSGLAPQKTLIHGGRAEKSFYFDSLFIKDDSLKYIPCSSTMEKEGFYSGRLTEYLKTEELELDRTFFICGSSEMVVQVRDILIDRGVDYDKIIAEIYF
ncbi:MULTISPECIES: ferredoxin--NADP reductase [unclassified Lentimicrobium]|uniref:ferredoxin--NADP reductase n=1 Tax=unclassified Lentimicrobium TaxID=2677434 RepID=UPI0015563E46|nr:MULTISPECIES: FAD-binding oxidoreductase [unclassified Lentimicrobium]NPD46029.1 oxidoreductase [Lentimicrobium sp. S6]NPD85229.1 oxidoreductase [Lentimicrobium sp. L6]